VLQNPLRKVSQSLCPLPLGQVPSCFSYLFLVYVPVDNDPHFIIHLPKSQRNICFNINSEPGKILNLVSDPGTGKGIKHGLFHSTHFFPQFWYSEGAGKMLPGRTVCFHQECGQQVEGSGYFPPLLKYCTQFEDCQYEKGVDKLE